MINSKFLILNIFLRLESTNSMLYVQKTHYQLFYKDCTEASPAFISGGGALRAPIFVCPPCMRRGSVVNIF